MRKSTLLMTVVFCIFSFWGGYFDKAGAETVTLIKDGDLFPRKRISRAVGGRDVYFKPGKGGFSPCGDFERLLL